MRATPPVACLGAVEDVIEGVSVRPREFVLPGEQLPSFTFNREGVWEGNCTFVRGNKVYPVCLSKFIHGYVQCFCTRECVILFVILVPLYVLWDNFDGK